MTDSAAGAAPTGCPGPDLAPPLPFATSRRPFGAIDGGPGCGTHRAGTTCHRLKLALLDERGGG